MLTMAYTQINYCNCVYYEIKWLSILQKSSLLSLLSSFFSPSQSEYEVTKVCFAM